MDREYLQNLLDQYRASKDASNTDMNAFQKDYDPNKRRKISFLRSIVDKRSFDDIDKEAMARDANDFQFKMGKHANTRKNLGDEVDANKNIFNLGEDFTKSDRNTQLFDRQTEDYTRNKGIQDREDDPDSVESKFAQQLAREMGLPSDGMTASRFKSSSPVLSQIFNVRAKKELAQEAAKDRALRRQEIGAVKSQVNDDRKAKGQVDLVAKLRKESTSGELGKLYGMKNQSSSARNAIQQFSANPSGYTDYGTLMTSLKTLQGDQSVVREAELRLGKNATSLFNKASNSVQSALNGKSLQPSQRKEIVDAMNILVTSYDSAYKKAARPIVIQAKRNQLPLDEIFDDPVAFDVVLPEEEEAIKGLSDEELMKGLFGG
jgi:hypothetical protein